MIRAGTSAEDNPYAQLAAQEHTAAPAAPVDQRPRRGRLSRRAGTYAGVALLFLLAFALVGVLWGLTRPTYTAYVEDPDTASIAVATDVEFLGFAWFTVLSGVLAAALSLLVFLRSPATRGPIMLYWLGLLSLLGAVIFAMFGEISANFLHRAPADYAAVLGSSFEVVPTFNAGGAVLAAPFLAMCIYWCAAWVTPEESATEPSTTELSTTEPSTTPAS